MPSDQSPPDYAKAVEEYLGTVPLGERKALKRRLKGFIKLLEPPVS